MKKILRLVFFFPYLLFGQNKTIDSLLKTIKRPTADTNTIKTYRAIAKELAATSIDSSNLFLRKGMALSREIGNKRFEFGCCDALAANFSSVSQFDSAFKYNSEALEQSIATKNKKLIAASYHNLATVLLNLGQYDKAINNYYKAMIINDELNNLIWKSYNLIGIGNVYNYGDSKDAKAIEYYEKALKILEEVKNEQGIAFCLNNIGLIYNRNGKYASAILNLEKALAINKKLGEEDYVASNLSNLGVSFYNLKDYGKASAYYSKALEIAQKLNDRNGVAIYLNALGNVFAKLNRFDKAIHYSERGLVLARKIKAGHTINKTIRSLIEFYVLSKNFEKASNYQTELMMINDSIYSESSTKAIAESEAKYQTEKREKENFVLRQQKELASQKENNQKIISISISCGLLIVIVFAIFVFNRLKLSNKQKKVIELQKQIVDAKQKEIIDSITYAKRIQTALITSDKYIERNLERLTRDV